MFDLDYQFTSYKGAQMNGSIRFGGDIIEPEYTITSFIRHIAWQLEDLGIPQGSGLAEFKFDKPGMPHKDVVFPY